MEQEELPPPFAIGYEVRVTALQTLHSHERLRHGRPARPAPHGPAGGKPRRKTPTAAAPASSARRPPPISSGASSATSSRRARARRPARRVRRRRENRHGPEVGSRRRTPTRRAIHRPRSSASSPLDRPRLSMIVVLDEPKDRLLRRPGLRARVQGHRPPGPPLSPGPPGAAPLPPTVLTAGMKKGRTP